MPFQTMVAEAPPETQTEREKFAAVSGSLAEAFGAAMVAAVRVQCLVDTGREPSQAESMRARDLGRGVVEAVADGSRYSGLAGDMTQYTRRALHTNSPAWRQHLASSLANGVRALATPEDGVGVTA